jgi:type IV pilus assembly protein PilC
MPLYACKTINASGQLKESKIEALSDVQARTQLQIKGERVLQIKELGSSESVPKVRRGKKPSTDEFAGMVRQLSILIRAGVPLVESLRGLCEQTSSETLRECLEMVANDVSQGMALSDAFSKHPCIFPGLSVEMARVAEMGGNLADSVGRLADHIESSAEIMRKVKSALSYPVVILITSFVTIVVMVTFILPRFMSLFEKMDAQLPWTTKMLMNFSHLMTSRWYVFVMIGVALFYLIRRYLNTPYGRSRYDAFLLKLPVVGDIVSKVVMSRTLAAMATLLASGVPMVQTLETSAAAANNTVVSNALQKVKKEVAEGTATSQSLKAAGVFPPLVVQMVASGEKTGELPSMLNYICALYEKETDAKVKSLTSIIEPIMIVFLGLIVGFIAMSVIIPIYSLVGGVK